MNNSPFNSVFEIALRIILFLSESKDGMTNDRISAYDFITIYGQTFGISEYPLHGNNELGFGEFAARRRLIQNALKSLVRENMVTVFQNTNGFFYKINKRGYNFCQVLDTNYAKTYKLFAKMTIKKYDSINEVQLLKIISKKSMESLRR